MVVCTSMMRKSNIFCRKLQLVVSKHCICTDMNTKRKAVHYMSLYYIVEYIQHVVQENNFREGLNLMVPILRPSHIILL